MTSKPRKPLLAVLAAAMALTMGLGSLLFAALIGAGTFQIVVFRTTPASAERDTEMVWYLAAVTTFLLAFAAVQLWGALRIWRRWSTGPLDESGD